MSKKRKLDTQTMRDMHRRADSSLIVYAVMLFEATGMGVLALRNGGIDWQAAAFAAGLPLITWLLTWALPKWLKVDKLLLTLTLFLCAVSLVTLTAIARSPVTPLDQAYAMGAGIVALLMGVGFARLVRKPRRWAPLIALAALAALAVPMVLGEWNNGAKNWITLWRGRISVQPGEFVKLALMVVLAAGLSGRSGRASRVLSLVFAAALCGILLLERDLGALLLYFLTTILVYFLATSNLPLCLAGLGTGAVGAVAAYKLLPYVQRRIAAWQNPWSDPTDTGFQIIQALIAIASGGLFGSGLGLGLPRNIPLYHSDFVFAAICEEFGCVFGVCLLAVYALIVMRGISIAMNAREGYHALLAFAVVAMLGLQTLLIVGGNIRLIPLTGVTLPMVAAGGSSMVSCMGGMGLLLGVSSINRIREEEAIERAEWMGGAAE